jgi:hypothetical protein
MATLTEPKVLSDFLLMEDVCNRYSREGVTVLSGQNLAIGQVVGKVTIGAATAAAKSGGNTGNGTIAMDATTPILADATVGVYQVRCITAGTNSATFRVSSPMGTVLGDFSLSGAGASGTFSNRLKFAITDGSTDFVVGDGFDITVAAGSGKVKAWTASAVDGSQYAYGIMGENMNASSADKASFAIVREAIVKANSLVWSGTPSATEKATALAQLEARGVTSRSNY